MTGRRRVRVWSNVKMVSLRGEPVVNDGEPTQLCGLADNVMHGVCVVKLDDGRELLIAREHLEVLP